LPASRYTMYCKVMVYLLHLAFCVTKFYEESSIRPKDMRKFAQWNKVRMRVFLLFIINRQQ
jgi:hypothetical protein